MVPCIESLEERRFLSGVGVVQIIGTSHNDFIDVNLRSRRGIYYTINGERHFASYSKRGKPVTLVVVDGGRGNDIIKVNATGFDAGELVSVRGGSGNDRIYVATATVDVTADGGSGNDNLIAGENHFYTNIRDQTGVTLSGGNGNDYIVGSAGDDALLGGNGNDTIVAGTGQDTAIGGAGDDVIIEHQPEDGGTVIDGGTGFNTLVTPDGLMPDEVQVERIQQLLQGN